jgi:HNH endonuclease
MTAPLFTQDGALPESVGSAETLNQELVQPVSSAVERPPHTRKVDGSIPSPATILSPIEIANFWGRVRVGQAFECWEWTGRGSDKGYGRWRGTQAHRVAYELVHGPIPDGLIVRHDCDNPPCCNPAHLLAGTHLDNSRDAEERDRLAYGARSGKVKLTDDQVREIWSNPDRLTGAQLATRFGVASSTISYVRNGGRRQRVTGPIIGAGG